MSKWSLLSIDVNKTYIHRIMAFSLIELLIVMVIIGIIASFAYPGYRDYITRARRSDGQSALLSLAGRMERFYSENNTYATATIGTGNTSDVLANSATPENWYILSIVNATPTTYTIQATPQGAQGQTDTRCQSLTLNHLGVKGVANGPAGAPTETADNCW